MIELMGSISFSPGLTKLFAVAILLLAIGSVTRAVIAITEFRLDRKKERILDEDADSE